MVNELIGRFADITRVRESLGSDSRTACVVGEPGAGKTAILDAVSDAVRAEGWQVITLRGRQNERALGFVGVIDLLTARDVKIGDALRAQAEVLTGTLTGTEAPSDALGLRLEVLGWLEAVATTRPLRLDLEQLDLYLIHWPAPGNDRYAEAWTALEELYAGGRVRAIGVSNFLPEHLRRIVDLGGTVPAVNQVELHPALQQREIIDADDKLGIATEASSPLAQGAMLTNPTITAIADRLGRTPAQVILRWHVEQGRIVIPKSVTPSRIAENFDLFGFSLDTDDLAAIDALEAGERTGPHPAKLNG